MIGLLVGALLLVGLLVMVVLFAVILFQAAVVGATPEAALFVQPGRTSPFEAGLDEGKAAP